MILHRALFLIAALSPAILAYGCRASQEPPVVMTHDPESGGLRWHDAEGPLIGEIGWTLRTDVLGPDVYLVVETDAGYRCAERVSFQVKPGGAFDVTRASDLRGRVAWGITDGGGKEIRTFTCVPRPADYPRACVKGGIPLPLFGKLVGSLQAQLEAGGAPVPVAGVRFERDPPACGA